MVSMTQWKTRFMARRELKYPTGRPLYTYRVTTAETGSRQIVEEENTCEHPKVAAGNT